MAVVGILQARMGSARLPGKVLRPLAGKPVVSWCYERASRSLLLDSVVVATSVRSSDDELAEFCGLQGLPLFRGSEEDVLGRYFAAARAAGASYVVRLTGDKPFVDPRIIDDMVEACLEGAVDFASNRLPVCTFPHGFDIEIMSFSSLQEAAARAHSPYEREHVTPYFQRSEFSGRVLGFRHASEHTRHRMTIDTAEDFEVCEAVAQALGAEGGWGWLDAVAFLRDNPDINNKNLHLEQPPGPSPRPDIPTRWLDHRVSEPRQP